MIIFNISYVLFTENDQKSYLADVHYTQSMANLNVAVLGSPGYAREFGKKGTESDITFYNLKKDEDTITLVEPSRYPERLASLFFTASLASIGGRAIIVLDELNETLGETVVMLHCAGVKEGYIILRNFITEEQVKPLIKDTLVENYKFVADEPIALREELLEITSKRENHADTKSGAVPIDHFFNVKGIGSVVLGCVFDGTIRKHDSLNVYPTTKSCVLRSIQKHDDDFATAGFGDRVGLALKNIETKDLDRGFVLSNDDTLKSNDKLTAEAELTKYWPNALAEDMILHIGHWFQFIPARVLSVDSSPDFRKPTLTLELEKPLAYPPGSQAVITYLESGKLRVVGTLKLV